MLFNYLVFLCLGVLAVQAAPPLQDPIDDLVRELEELNRMVSTERQQATDGLGGELRSLDEISADILGRLEEDLTRDVEILARQVHDLEREARDRHVDISECIGDQLEEIMKLPERALGETGVCLNMAHAQAEQAVEDGLRKIDEAVGPIDEYWRQLERCRGSRPDEQHICIAELNTEIRNDGQQIPSRIHLVVGEVMGHLEAEKASLRLCSAGKVEKLNDDGERIIRRIADCAEHILPPRPPTH